MTVTNISLGRRSIFETFKMFHLPKGDAVLKKKRGDGSSVISRHLVISLITDI